MAGPCRGAFEWLRPTPPTRKLRNLDFGSNLGVWGSGRGLKRRGAPAGSIWVEFQLKWSHGDLFRDQNHVFDETSQLLGIAKLLLGTD